MFWKTVITFWFKENGMKQWFRKSAAFDARVRRKFLKTYQAAAKGELADWRKTAKGRLAEIIVLDQFARNMFRGKAQAFANDSLALALAQEAVRHGADKKLGQMERMFLYLPFMHSESKKIQRESVKLFRKLGNKEALRFAKDHKKIIDRFGSFPHRNKALGRKTTASEKRFMKTHKGY